MTSLQKLKDRVLAEDGSLQLFRDFVNFHRSNPNILRWLVDLTKEAVQAGHKNYGIGAIYEVMRWEVNVKTKKGKGLKLSNNHRAFYARLIEIEHPELKGFFRTRHLSTHGKLSHMASAVGIMFLMVLPRAPTAPTQAYIDMYNQQESFRYYHDQTQYQQQEYMREQGVDLPPPLPVLPPSYLFTIPGGEGGEE